jgi:hypothetical protein
LVEAGESVLVFGRLRCPAASPDSAAARTVALVQRTLGASEVKLAQATTGPGGFYEMAVPDVQRTSTVLVDAQGLASAARVIKVLAHVTLQGPADGAQLFTAPAEVTFSGTVSPDEAGALAVLQRKSANIGSEWRRIGAARVGPEGRYSIRHTFLLAGEGSIRVLVRGPGGPPSASEVRSYEISQPQNPQLTINASADPISVGQHVTISGRLAGAPRTPVTLLAHALGHPGFAPVAEVRTDTSGRYTFPPQAPSVNTYYEARGAGRLSAELYEGARELLSAQVSATTLQAGQALTFSGSVAPARPGGFVYLERENKRSGGFHVVQAAPLAANSSYTLVYPVFASGSSVFRVKVPGSSAYAGATSAPFTIQVTPAPASALVSDARGEWTPPEGQI